MNETYRANEAARVIVAGLKLLREHAKRSGLSVTASDLIYHAESRISDECVMPWLSETPERPERDLPWSAVLREDSVLAPNGQWYEVTAWSRIGDRVTVMLKLGDATAKSYVPAGAEVKVRRGPTGQAADMFADAGMSLEAGA